MRRKERRPLKEPQQYGLRVAPGLARSLFILLGAAGLILLLSGGLTWRQAIREQHRLDSLNQQISDLFRDSEESVAPETFRDLETEAATFGGNLPEAEYAALHQQWRRTIRQFDQVAAAQNNRFLQPRTGELLKTLQGDLLSLRDAATRSLETPPLPSPDQSWQIYNLRGCVSVLLASSMLYFQEDETKGAKFLSDALEDFKQAIRQVDRAGLSSPGRVLPRWNLELIVSVGEYRLTGIPDLSRTDPTEIRKQLQAFIPEAPGFSPGVPLETRVEK